ncbi:MAG TPA: RHS repeat-associated core domain-containing protein, partial [Polyangia bacterium]
SRDAFGRVATVLEADRESFSSVAYFALGEAHYDAEDNDAARAGHPASPHVNTPTERWVDGHGRLIRVVQHNRTSAVEATLTTGYAYDALGGLTQITDAAGNIKRQGFDTLGRQVTMSDPNAGAWPDPNMGAWIFEYDAAGNLTHYRDAKFNHLYYGYDPANRLRWERHGTPAAPNDVTYIYDVPFMTVGGHGYLPDGSHHDFVLGRLAWVQDPSGMRFASYDARGRQTADLRSVLGYYDNKKRTRTYDDLDREIGRTLPGGTALSFAYSGRGLLESVDGYVDSIDYDAAGQPTRRVLSAHGTGPTTVATWRYDALRRLRSQKTELSDGTLVLLDRTVELDRVGNVLGITQSELEGRAPGGTPPPGWLASYDLRTAPAGLDARTGYDALYRLLGVNYAYQDSSPIRPTQVQFAHDGVGNLLGMDANRGGYLDSHFGTATYKPGTYQLVHAEKADPPYGTNTVDLIYDPNGNVVQITTVDVRRDLKTMLGLVWDHNNHLTSVTKSTGPAAGSVTARVQGTFVYDHAGQLAKKTITPLDTYVADVTAYYAEDYELRHGTHPIKYVFVGGERLAKIVDQNEPYVPQGFQEYKFFLHADMLHTASAVTDQQGALVERRNYLPYGQPEADHSEAAFASYHEPYGFTGKEYDAELGIQYFGARWYVPGIGRWASADPLFLLNPEKAAEVPARLNLYDYVRDNPLTLTDPDGQSDDGPAHHKADAIAPARQLTDKQIKADAQWRRQMEWDSQSFRTDKEKERYERMWDSMGTFGLGGITKVPGQAANGLLSRLWGAAKNGLRRLLPAGAAQGAWKVGQDIWKRTAKGTPPSWSTVRSRFWKNEAARDGANARWGESNVRRMRRGLAPERFNPDKGGMEAMELSHEPLPARAGGHRVVPRWPQDHAAVDPYRRPGY